MESSLGVPSYMLQNIRTKEPQGFGYTDPTSIQMQAIPILLAVRFVNVVSSYPVSARCVIDHIAELDSWMLSQKRELMGVAPTGSGKTASFIIPLLTLLKVYWAPLRSLSARSVLTSYIVAQNPDKAGFRGLILAPTKELADQITRHVKKLAQVGRLNWELVNR